MSANFKQQRTSASSGGFLRIERLSCSYCQRLAFLLFRFFALPVFFFLPRDALVFLAAVCRIIVDVWNSLSDVVVKSTSRLSLVVSAYRYIAISNLPIIAVFVEYLGQFLIDFNQIYRHIVVCHKTSP